MDWVTLSVESKTEGAEGKFYSEDLAPDTELNIGYVITIAATSDDSPQVNVHAAEYFNGRDWVDVYPVLNGDIVSNIEDAVVEYLDDQYHQSKHAA